MALIDLHTHSTASDGTDSPTALVAKAAKAGLCAIAITDHDTLSGLPEAEEAAKKVGIELVRGCEISTTCDLGELHILGLWAPHDCSFLNDFIAHGRKRRHRRNELMLDKLEKLGIHISMEELMAQTRGLAGRPHIAQLLTRKGYSTDRADAFRKFLGRGAAAYVPKNSPSPEEACRVLAEAGATVSLAHPFLYHPAPYILEEKIKKLSKTGLSAIEVWHSSHGEKQTNYLKEMATRLGLGMSGGSDYHGVAKPGINLGAGYGNLHITRSALTGLKALRGARGLPC